MAPTARTSVVFLCRLYLCFLQIKLLTMVLVTLVLGRSKLEKFSLIVLIKLKNVLISFIVTYRDRIELVLLVVQSIS